MKLLSEVGSKSNRLSVGPDYSMVSACAALFLLYSKGGQHQHCRLSYQEGHMKEQPAAYRITDWMNPRGRASALHVVGPQALTTAELLRFTAHRRAGENACRWATRLLQELAAFSWHPPGGFCRSVQAATASALLKPLNQGAIDWATPAADISGRAPAIHSPSDAARSCSTR